MKRILYLGFGLLLFVQGCANKEKPEGTLVKERNFGEPTELSVLDSMNINETFDLWESWTINANSIGFSSYGINDGFLSVYSYPDCQKLYSWGKIGQGPDEFITLNSCRAENGTIVLYDIMGRKLRKVVIGNDSVHIQHVLPLYDDPQEGLCKPFTYISPIEGSKYLMKVDDYNGSSWEVADLEQGKVLCSYPNPLRTPDIDPYTPVDFEQSVCDSVFLAAYNYIDRVEIYSIANGGITPKCIYGSSEVPFSQTKCQDLISYYISVASQSGLFYCLRSKDGKEELGDEVEVYDVEGNCKRKYILERPVASINVDMEGHLVGYVAATDCTILYRYDLK